MVPTVFLPSLTTVMNNIFFNNSLQAPRETVSKQGVEDTGMDEETREEARLGPGQSSSPAPPHAGCVTVSKP